MNKSNFSLALFFAFLVPACKHGFQDVTKDPEYHFATMVKTEWRLKKPIALRHINANDVGWGSVCTEEYLKDFSAGKADPWKYGGKIEDIAPTGTTFRIEYLMTGSSEMGGVNVVITFLDGKFKDDEIESPQELFLKNQYFGTGQSDKWEINPENLEKP